MTRICTWPAEVWIGGFLTSGQLSELGMLSNLGDYILRIARGRRLEDGVWLVRRDVVNTHDEHVWIPFRARIRVHRTLTLLKISHAHHLLTCKLYRRCRGETNMWKEHYPEEVGKLTCGKNIIQRKWGN